MIFLIAGMMAMPANMEEANAESETTPQIKKSKNGICHPKGGTYYKRTKTFTPYPNMDACLQSRNSKPQ